jgi:3-methyl-2-oxobutanoate hydroxymethyltransferase
VVEGVAESLAREVTAAMSVPTIGIGASAGCDGQVLVVDDMLGLFDWTPKFVRRYADLKGEIERAAADYARDVKDRTFPGEAETYYAGKAKAPLQRTRDDRNRRFRPVAAGPDTL